MVYYCKRRWPKRSPDRTDFSLSRNISRPTSPQKPPQLATKTSDNIYWNWLSRCSPVWTCHSLFDGKMSTCHPSSIPPMTPFVNWTRLLTIERDFTKPCCASDMTGGTTGFIISHTIFSNIFVFNMKSKNFSPKT
jgi:hypothetical protein